MFKNELPSLQAPYKLDAGEGMRYAFGSQLATRIATPVQLGQAASGTFLTGAKGSAFPLHRHHQTHEALFVMKGTTKLLLGGEKFLLTPGDYVNIPPGTPHRYEFLDHHSQLLSWTFGGNAAEAYGTVGRDDGGNICCEENGRIERSVLGRGVDTEVLDHAFGQRGSFAEKLSSAPQGMVPFVVAAGEGGRMIAGDQLYTSLGNQAHSNGTFIALL